MSPPNSPAAKFASKSDAHVRTNTQIKFLYCSLANMLHKETNQAIFTKINSWLNTYLELDKTIQTAPGTPCEYAWYLSKIFVVPAAVLFFGIIFLLFQLIKYIWYWKGLLTGVLIFLWCSGLNKIKFVAMCSYNFLFMLLALCE